MRVLKKVCSERPSPVSSSNIRFFRKGGLGSVEPQYSDGHSPFFQKGPLSTSSINRMPSESGPIIQRYTPFSEEQQRKDRSLGWKHPARTDIRVSDDGLMAVEDKGWNPNSNKRAWTTEAKVKESNAILKAVGSAVRFVKAAGRISGKPPMAPRAKQKKLVEVVPEKASGRGPFSLRNDCGSACRQIMGSGTKDVAVTKNSGVERYTSGRTYHGTRHSPTTTPEEFFQEILQRHFGRRLSRKQLYRRYAALNPRDKDQFDRRYGINKYAVPAVGQGQTISTERHMPGFRLILPPSQTWNFHYAATVFKSAGDHVTLESAAGWGLTDWIYYMYGPARKAQSFHEEHGRMGSHGSHYTTMVVQPEKVLRGKTNARGVHLVGNPLKWKSTRIAKLGKGSQLMTLAKGRNWRKVRVETGPHRRRIGWMMNRYFKPL